MDKPVNGWMKERGGPRAYGEQDENGVDLSLIRENFRLSYEERIRKADAARRQAQEMMDNARGRLHSATGPAR
jgi:hypothetical protein